MSLRTNVNIVRVNIMDENKLYCIVDNRTGQRVSVATFLSRWRAEDTIKEWKTRDLQGGRPDCHDLIPYLEVREL